MVEEAQLLRARVLADLSRRRKVLHAQIEQLRAGRERLAETVNEVRQSVEAIAGDLFRAEDEARLAAEVAGREVSNRGEEGTLEEMATLLLAEEAEVEAAEMTAIEEVAVVAVVADVADVADGGTPVEESGDDRAEAQAVPEAGVDEEAGAAAPPVEQVDALFAKLRAAQGDDESGPSDATEAGSESEPVAQDSQDDPATQGTGEASDADDGPPETRNPLVVQRDELMAPLVTGLARRMKRILQDNQNDLLDHLRAKGTSWSPALLPDEKEHLDSVTTAALPLLEEAAEAGASFLGKPTGKPTGKPAGKPTAKSKSRPSGDALIAIAHDLAESVVGPLRKRLLAGDGLESAEESVVTEHVGSAFREWKGERIERLAGDHVVAAFSLGSLAVAGAGGTSLEWVAVALPDETPCPDCEDNGLNGAQPAGEEFPTGHLHPPAHPGCRCLLAPATP